MAAKILIVDDMLFMRETLKKMLVDMGCEIVGEADNGEDAIQQYKALNPDLVTLDITMPKLDGLGALRGILDYDSSATVVMVSALGQEKTVLNCIKSGAKNFVVKPFKPAKLTQALAPLLGL